MPAGTDTEPGQVWQSDWHRGYRRQHELCPDAACVQLARQFHAHWDADASWLSERHAEASRCCAHWPVGFA